MPTDLSLRALREANPSNQPGFNESVACYDPLWRQIADTPVGAQGRPQLAGRRRLIALSAAAVACLSLAGALVGLMLSAASPQSAYAAAKKAVAATSGGALDSGTMTLTVVHSGNTWTSAITQWNGNDISMVSGGEKGLLFANRKLLLVGGGVYLQTADGTWLHYASEAEVGDPLNMMVQLAHDNAGGFTADEILALATDLQKVVQPDGSTVYSGTIPASDAGAEVAPTDDTATRDIAMLPRIWGGGQLQLVVGSDGLVRQISETADDGSGGWSFQYSQLGSTPPISPPATSTDATSGTPAMTTEPTPTETLP